MVWKYTIPVHIISGKTWPYMLLWQDIKYQVQFSKVNMLMAIIVSCSYLNRRILQTFKKIRYITKWWSFTVNNMISKDSTWKSSYKSSKSVETPICCAYLCKHQIIFWVCKHSLYVKLSHLHTTYIINVAGKNPFPLFI